MSSPWLAVPLALLAALPVAGCVADISGVFGKEDGDGSGGAGGAVSGPTSGQNGASTSGPGSTTTGDPATTSVTTGNATSATVGTTTGATTGSGDPPGDTVGCGSQTCSVDQDGICCWVYATGSGTCAPGPNSCENTGTIGGLKTAIECQFPSQCDGGDICCTHRDFDGAPYDDTSCDSSCDLPDRHLCDPSAPVCPLYQDQNGDPVQSVCKASTLLPPGYFVCGF